MVAEAIASFERTLVSYDSDLDRYLSGATSALSDGAKRGMELFTGKAGCVKCHNGPLLSDQKKHYTGVPELMGDSPQGTPYKTPKASIARARVPDTARWAFPPRRFAAVMDWPSGPSTIHKVGTAAAAPILCPARRFQISVVIMMEASRLSPNIA